MQNMFIETHLRILLFTKVLRSLRLKFGMEKDVVDVLGTSALEENKSHIKHHF